MEFVLIGFLGVGLGCVLGFFGAVYLNRTKEKTAKELADELYIRNESLRKDDRESVMMQMKDSFSGLSLDALKKFLEVAKEQLDGERALHTKELDSKKGLIDQQLVRMNKDLDGVQRLMQSLEKDRENKFGELSKQIEEAGKRTAELADTTKSLHETLASTQSRGQWGERMAEDVLRVAGLIENVNYVKQKAIEGGSKPDFTFSLPKNLFLNMDVKFPFSNYMNYIDSDSEADRDAYLKLFLRDVRLRVKEVTSRDYINPEQNTVDYVLLFIPNEQIYAFIHEMDRSLVDDSLQKKVIICSPMTLYSVLVVIRASVDNFALEQKSNRILQLLGTFKKQWDLYKGKMEKLGRSIETAKKDYDHLASTRNNMLDKPINELDDIRNSKGIELEDSDGMMMLGDAGEE